MMAEDPDLGAKRAKAFDNFKIEIKSTIDGNCYDGMTLTECEQLYAQDWGKNLRDVCRDTGKRNIAELLSSAHDVVKVIINSETQRVHLFPATMSKTTAEIMDMIIVSNENYLEKKARRERFAERDRRARSSSKPSRDFSVSTPPKASRSSSVFANRDSQFSASNSVPIGGIDKPVVITNTGRDIAAENDEDDNGWNQGWNGEKKGFGFDIPDEIRRNIVTSPLKDQKSSYMDAITPAKGAKSSAKDKDAGKTRERAVSYIEDVIRRMREQRRFQKEASPKGSKSSSSPKSSSSKDGQSPSSSKDSKSPSSKAGQSPKKATKSMSWSSSPTKVRMDDHPLRSYDTEMTMFEFKSHDGFQCSIPKSEKQSTKIAQLNFSELMDTVRRDEEERRQRMESAKKEGGGDGKKEEDKGQEEGNRKDVKAKNPDKEEKFRLNATDDVFPLSKADFLKEIKKNVDVDAEGGVDTGDDLDADVEDLTDRFEAMGRETLEESVLELAEKDTKPNPSKTQQILDNEVQERVADQTIDNRFYEECVDESETDINDVPDEDVPPSPMVTKPKYVSLNETYERLMAEADQSFNASTIQASSDDETLVQRILRVATSADVARLEPVAQMVYKRYKYLKKFVAVLKPCQRLRVVDFRAKIRQLCGIELHMRFFKRVFGIQTPNFVFAMGSLRPQLFQFEEHPFATYIELVPDAEKVLRGGIAEIGQDLSESLRLLRQGNVLIDSTTDSDC
ncbi:unnamed protein product [Bursaphelenchus okinawaensis]|uniref:Uncharacterized protein n=1 Tax=Bursaphelenchus okinawaensis TaxID=465554 RepID=A0A811LLA5_9BILA|nr:unnamed protein product [Bursaphelenchus okinawaensis]CAG9124500.1 unnamed protein product [Bursaphelenchus okinawaensis]